MAILKQAACIILLVVTPLLATASQNPVDKKAVADKETNPAGEKKPALDAAQKKVLAVLDQLLETQKSFADDNLRIVIQAHVADILWGYNQPRARRLFEEAFQAIATARALGRSPSVPQTYADCSGRIMVIQLLMQHDSALATKLVESVADGSPPSNLKPTDSRYVRPSERVMLQQQLALRFIQQDPARAVQAAQLLVEKGDYNWLMIVLGMLRVKDAKAADGLFLQALVKARLGQPSFFDLSRLGTYLFHAFGEGVLQFSSTAGHGDPLQPINIGSGTVEQFMELAYDTVMRRLDAAMSNAEGAQLNARSLSDYALPKILMPYVDRFMPERAAAFRVRVEEALRRVPQEDQPYLIMTDTGTIQELVARADTMTNAEVKDSLYHRAVIQATYGNNLDQAAALIDKISSENRRASAREIVQRRMDEKRDNEAWQALNKSDYDKAQALVAEFSNGRPPLVLLGSLIGQLAYKDKPRAIQILDDAERQAASIESSMEKAQRLMALAGIAANLDAERGFGDMEIAIKEFNRAGFAPEWSRYEAAPAGANGKPVTSANVGLSELLSTRDFQTLGRMDLDRALMLTQQFQLREAAAIVQLAVCRGALVKYQASIPQKAPVTAKPPPADKVRQP
jgi:hypothetical protein